MTTLKDRLARGDIILMDGGVSTEIEKQGVAMDSTVWSGVAHVTHPDVARKVHESYIRAGAEVITANTFATARHVLEGKGMGDDFEMINRRAVEVAQEARDNAAGSNVLVAASISTTPTFDGDRYTERGAAALQNYRDQAAIYADAGADLIVLEMMLDLESSIPCTTAAVESGLPVWVGFSASLRNSAVIGYNEGARKRPTIDFAELVKAVMAIGGEAAGVMHSFVDTTGPALDVLADHWQGPKLAYAETGEFRNPDWVFEQGVSADEYADVVEGWVRDQGVQIIGGCCGTRPEHIQALHERFCEK
jgi:homocysteine S-methyltransferase